MDQEIIFHFLRNLAALAIAVLCVIGSIGGFSEREYFPACIWGLYGVGFLWLALT